jgi:nitroreductase
MIEQLILRNRSYRRFDVEARVERATLRQLVDLARLSGSAMNLQPFKYVLSCEPERNAAIFPHLAWAGYLKDWDGPAEGERPSAYIVILGDTQIARSFGCDHGIAAQSILLGAVEKGLGGCMISAIERKGLRKALGVADRYEILLVIALGKPKETVVVKPVGASGSISYWRDADGTHHVPKRSLDEIIIG